MTKLRIVPEHERTLFVLLGHVVNEINVLNKTFYLATQFEEEPRWRVHAHISQSLVFARALVGKLNEGWELLQKGYFNSQLSREYDKHLDSHIGDATLLKEETYLNIFGTLPFCVVLPCVPLGVASPMAPPQWHPMAGSAHRSRTSRARDRKGD